MLCLLLPALKRGDEETNRLQCLDNLRTIGGAAHEYNELNGHLPPYMGIPFNPSDCFDYLDHIDDYQSTYSLVQLLDLLGQSKLAAAIDPFAFSNDGKQLQCVGYSTFQRWLIGVDDKRPGVNAILSGIDIAEFRCPSDPDAPRDRIIGQMHPSNNACISWQPWFGKDNFSITNYVANMGAIAVTTAPSPGIIDLGFVGFHGPIRSQTADDVVEIEDGASNTVMFGESLGENTNGDYRNSLVIGGIALGQADLYNTEQVFGSAIESRPFQFGSMHPDDVNVVFADGVTRSINRNIDSTTFGRMCGVEDGLPFLDFQRD